MSITKDFFCLFSHFILSVYKALICLFLKWFAETVFWKILPFVCLFFCRNSMINSVELIDETCITVLENFVKTRRYKKKEKKSCHVNPCNKSILSLPVSHFRKAQGSRNIFNTREMWLWQKNKVKMHSKNYSSRRCLCRSHLV